jgi:hypothetical protein
LKLLPLLILFSVFAATGQLRAGEAPEQVVHAFVAAFNAHDPDAMIALASEDIQWLFVNGDKVMVEAAGKEALLKSMTGYFKSIPSAKSKVEKLMSAGNYVTVLERASWETKDGTRSQAALAVYLVEKGKIRSVWYYPEQ